MISQVTPSIYLVNGDDTLGPNPKIGILLGEAVSVLIDVSNKKPMLAEALSFLAQNRPDAKIKLALTHFHPDHIDNLEYLPDGIEVFATKNTARYLSRSVTLVQQEQTLNLGEREISLIPVPSLHAKGCLDILDGKYLFVGDALFSHEVSGGVFYNRETVVEMVKKYEAIPFEIAIPSHAESFQKKNEVTSFLHRLVIDPSAQANQR